MFRNVTAAVAPVAAVNNYLLPLWMIAFGVVLLRQAYVMTSGGIFGLITMVHVWRVFEEGTRLATEPGTFS